MQKYKVEVRVIMFAMQTVEVAANSIPEAIKKAEDEVLDHDVDEFENIEIEETEVSHIQLLEEVAV